MHLHEHNHYHADLRSLAIAITTTLTIAIVQLIGSIISSSLALLSDSAHMVVDLSSLLIAYFSLRLAHRRTERQRFTFGWRRVEILAALANGIALLVICLLIAIEAVERISSPRIVHTTPMLVTATIGLLANGIAWYVLRGATHLTTRSAYLHVLNDLLSSVVVIVGGVVMRLTGWHLLDPLLSLAITAFIARSGIGIIRRAVVILMESAPDHVPLESVRRALHEHPSVHDVHDLHVWQLGATSHAMSAHIVVADGADRDRMLSELHGMLNERFAIRHATLQVEGKPFADTHGCCGCEHNDPFALTDDCTH
ncbi:MAG: cation diffusion facilitator family transporter [Chlorobi bacterium]|nr:cation diffusion facilitator family transporter [Chlorobiota bacterium]